MNTKVTATGMQVQAKSNSVYLLISSTAASDTADKIQAENTGKGNTAVTVTTAAAEVYPSALATVATKTGVKKTAITDYSDPASWYTSSAADAGSYASVTDKETALTALTDYVLSFTYRFTLADGSEDASNLHVKQITVAPETLSATAPTVSPVSIVVVNHADQSKVATFTVGSTAAETDGSYILTEASATALAATVTDTTVVTLDVYVYYDGNNAAVYTNNSANLNGAGITIEFEVE